MGIFLYVIWFNPGQSAAYYALLLHYSPVALFTQNIAGAVAQGAGSAGFIWFAIRAPTNATTSRWRPLEAALPVRWHIHCAVELPSHFDAVALEDLIRDCWAKVEWGYGRILFRDGANAGWINYMLKDRQKSEFDGYLDCIIIESLHNPIADA